MVIFVDYTCWSRSEDKTERNLKRFQTKHKRILEEKWIDPLRRGFPISFKQGTKIFHLCFLVNEPGRIFASANADCTK